VSLMRSKKTSELTQFYAAQELLNRGHGRPATAVTGEGGTGPAPDGQDQTFIAGVYGTPVTNWLPVVIDASGKLGRINPQTGGGIPAPLSTVVQLQQQVRNQQTTITDLRATIADQSARPARLEALIGPSAGAAKP
jgi:hypothetical protein